MIIDLIERRAKDIFIPFYDVVREAKLDGANLVKAFILFLGERSSHGVQVVLQLLLIPRTQDGDHKGVGILPHPVDGYL